jgi:predicted nucleotidyltransferase
MRLKEQQIETIKQQAAKLAPGAEVFVFGSRANPSASGGDIDLLLLGEAKLPLSILRRLRRAILQQIGEQKLDIVSFARSTSHPFKDIALTTATKL